MQQIRAVIAMQVEVICQAMTIQMHHAFLQQISRRINLKSHHYEKKPNQKQVMNDEHEK